MVEVLKKLLAVFGFVKWILPKDGCSLRFYISLLSVLLFGRQSVYYHFRLLKGASSRPRFKKFISELASVRVPDSELMPTSVPARLLARLLRTIYLTEVLPRKEEAAQCTASNHGYINHPQFSYGESLQSLIRSQTRSGEIK